jgi:hypothetical protein
MRRNLELKDDYPGFLTRASAKQAELSGALGKKKTRRLREQGRVPDPGRERRRSRRRRKTRWK